MASETCRVVGVAQVKRVGTEAREKDTFVEAQSGKEPRLWGAETMILWLELKLQGSDCPEYLQRAGRASPAEPRGP